MTDEGTRVIDERALLAGNVEWQQGFAWGGLETRPAKHLTVLTCMDSRYTAQGALGLALGDTHVLRNAGGRVTEDVIRSLVLSAHALGTRGCIVIHHTSCGLYGVTNEALRGQVTANTGQDASSIDFLPFDDTAASVREDLAALRACTLLPAGYEVLGFIYDVQSGQLQPVSEE